MKRRLAPWLLMLCLAWLSEIAAASAPKVLAIRFAGNHTTRPSTMLRELTFGVGDAYDAERVEASRQAIQDLGLFRAVTVRAETLEPLDGGRVCELVGVDGGLRGLGTRLNHRRQDLALLCGEAAYRLDQVGNQVGAALILILYLGPCGLGLFLVSRNVVHAAGAQQRQKNRHQEPCEGAR